MTLKEADGKTVEEIETKIIAKDGIVTRVPGKFQDEEELERNEVDSDLESTASSKPKRMDLENTCESGSRLNPNSAEDVLDYMFPDYPFTSKLRYA
ncbi:hypothetical protein Tco_1159230 [Tanacetum coccineum]